MLKETWKQNLVLGSFSLLLFEVLSIHTLVLVITGIILSSFGIRPHRHFRNFLAIAIFASYWLTYGKIIDPEIGLNFLTSIIVLKILEKETLRDRYMIFFGLLLLISAGSLFERTLTYVLFFAVGFLFLVSDFYAYLDQRVKLRNLGLSFLWVLPLTFFMFFFLPRIMNPIPFPPNTMAPGEVGYTPDVNISEIESLQINQAPVFQVSVRKELSQSELYWRGNTLSFTDGWNWRETPHDKEEPLIFSSETLDETGIYQSFRLFIRPDYYFALDVPSSIIVNDKLLGLAGNTKTLAQRKWNWTQRYQAHSHPEEFITEKEVPTGYLQLPVSRKEKEELLRTFSGETVKEISDSIRTHFTQEGFSYSLSPGRMPGLRDFLKKKSGFCSHYASAVAIIFRAKKIPSRLVSGFMGGTFNRFADFYLVSQSDAHVWVEVLSDGKWQRLDPTAWIAPDRVTLGGGAFLETVDQGAFRGTQYFRLPGIFKDFKLWFQQWDFLFYQWLEEVDYHSQNAWFEKLKLKRNWAYGLIPLMVLAFIVLYLLFLKIQQEKSLSPHHELWNLFFRKMAKKGIVLSRTSIRDSEKILRSSTFFSPYIEIIWEDLKSYSFGKSSTTQKELKKKIKGL